MMLEELERRNYSSGTIATMFAS